MGVAAEDTTITATELSWEKVIFQHSWSEGKASFRNIGREAQELVGGELR